MAVPTTIADISTTAASNSPAGSDSIGTSADDFLRSIQAIMKQQVSTGTQLASSTTITPLADGNFINVTGTTTITTIASTNSWNGRVIWMKFTGALQLTHSSTLVMPGARNYTTRANDVLAFVQESSGTWRCVSIQNHRDTVSVKDFGAVGNGVTDDTAEIQAAIDAVAAAGGGVVEAPAGRYLISSTLTGRVGVSIRGPAPETFPLYPDDKHLGTAIFALAAGSDCRLIEFTEAQAISDGAEVSPANSIYHWNLSISNISFDGYGASQTTSNHGIYAEKAWSIDIEDCSLQHVRGVGIYLNDCNECTVSGVSAISESTDNTMSWLVLKDSADCKIENNSFFGSIDPPVVLDASIKCALVGNLIGNAWAAGGGTYNRRDGIYLTASNNNIISSNRVDQNWGHGIYVGSGTGNVITGNACVENGFNNANAGYCGILCAGDSNVITGNRASDTGATAAANQDIGIKLTGTATGNIVVGNNCDGNDTNKIVNDSSGVNYIDGWGDDPIHIFSMQIHTGTPAIGAIGASAYTGWLFDSASTERIQTFWTAPQDWATCTFTVEWTNAGAGAGGVEWYIDLRDASAASNINTVSAELHGAIETAPAQYVIEHTTTTTYTVVGGKTYLMTLYRYPAGGSDTLGNDAALVGLRAVRAS